MAFKVLRKIKYALFILFVIGLVAVFYLSSVGLPEAVVHRIEPYLQFKGMVLSLEKIKLSIFEGVVATSVRYYKLGDVGEPVVQADKFVLKLEPLAWMRGGNGISGAIIKNGRVQFSPGGDAAGKIVLENIYADVLFEQQQSRLRILNVATVFYGVKLSGKGVIIMPSGQTETFTGESGGQTNISMTGASNSDQAGMVLLLKDFVSSNAVNVSVDFFINPENIEQLSVKADVHGRNTRYAGALVGGWSANISVRGKKVDGNITLKDAEIEGLSIQSLGGLVQYDGTGVVSASLKSMVSGGECQAGDLALKVKYNVPAGEFEGRATTGCDLRVFVPLLKSFKLKLADIFADFDFKRFLPSGDVSFKLSLKPEFCCHINGELLSDTLFFKRVSCLLVKVGFDAVLNESGEKITISPILIVRDEGLARGSLIYDSEGSIISFSAMSMADPQAVAMMISPVVVSALKPFSFSGLCYVIASGKVGLTNSLPNDFEISFNASDVRWKIFRFTPCSLTMQMEENNIKIDDFHGSICRGVINGSASFDQVTDSTNMLFALSARVDNVDFGVLINSLTGKELENAYEGTCSASFSLQGLLEDADNSSMTGKGWVKIENGHIFTVPIFSGLFDILGKAIPGMGHFNGKNNAHADLTVGKGKVHGRNVYIDGDVFSVKGSGDVYFDGRLDFKVQITFGRRQSLIGNLIQIVTLPITKAMELHLGGTIAEPKWELSYLPW